MTVIQKVFRRNIKYFISELIQEGKLCKLFQFNGIECMGY